MRSLSYLLAQPRLHRRLDDLRLVEGEAEIPRGLQENASVGECSLCLSRACHGKIITFIYKWRKTGVSLTCSVRSNGL